MTELKIDLIIITRNLMSHIHLVVLEKGGGRNGTALLLVFMVIHRSGHMTSIRMSFCEIALTLKGGGGGHNVIRIPIRKENLKSKPNKFRLEKGLFFWSP